MAAPGKYTTFWITPGDVIVKFPAGLEPLAWAGMAVVGGPQGSRRPVWRETSWPGRAEGAILRLCRAHRLTITRNSACGGSDQRRCWLP